MTLDDLTNAQFAMLTLAALGCVLLVGLMISMAIDRRRD
jgi:hypothetical protein